MNYIPSTAKPQNRALADTKDLDSNDDDEDGPKVLLSFSCPFLSVTVSVLTRTRIFLDFEIRRPVDFKPCIFEQARSCHQQEELRLPPHSVDQVGGMIKHDCTQLRTHNLIT